MLRRQSSHGRTRRGAAAGVTKGSAISLRDRYGPPPTISLDALREPQATNVEGGNHAPEEVSFVNNAQVSASSQMCPFFPQLSVIQTMTTFYNSQGVRITEGSFSVGRRQYPIDKLNNLRKARGPADPIAQRAAATAALSLLTVIVIGPIVSSSTIALIAAMFVAAPAAIAAVRVRLRPAEYQLWADFHGHPVRLYQSRDRTEFGKISRALIRASCKQT